MLMSAMAAKQVGYSRPPVTCFPTFLWDEGLTTTRLQITYLNSVVMPDEASSSSEADAEEEDGPVSGDDNEGDS